MNTKAKPATPLTDAATFDCVQDGEHDCDRRKTVEVVRAELSRKLERDRAALLEALKLCLRCMDGPRIPKYMETPVKQARALLRELGEE
jgi:hypothetical protein